MAIQFQIISPISGEVDVPVNTEAVVRIYEDAAAPIVSIDVTIDDGDFPVLAFSGRTSVDFLSDWTGEVIYNASNFTDITLILIRPISHPTYPPGRTIGVEVDATT